MADIPRLKQFADISVVPRPTPDPAAASMVQRTLAQGEGQLSQEFGQIAAKDITASKIERSATARLNAENAVHEMTAKQREETDKVRFGQVGYGSYTDIPEFSDQDPNSPIQTDHLMRVYSHIQDKYRKMGLDALKDHGVVSQYAFANEYDSISAAHLEKLYTDRNQRKVGDLQGDFEKATKNIIDYSASGTYSTQDALEKYESLLDGVGKRIFSPEQQSSRRKSDMSAIRLAPYYQKATTFGGATQVFEQIESGQIKELNSEELLNLSDKVNKRLWEFTSQQSAKRTQERKDFDEGSERIAKDRLGDWIKKGTYTRPMLSADAPFLTKEDYSFLNSALSIQETQGGVGNPVLHSEAKFDIALHSQNWSPERITAVTQKEGMNPTEGLDLLNEWYKARSQRRNAENDPNHFSKDHRFKLYMGGIRNGLGVSPFSVLKPQDEALVERAEQDFYDIFQMNYDAKKPLPDFQVEWDRVIQRYQNKFSWLESTEVNAYGDDSARLMKDYKSGFITQERFNEAGNQLIQRRKQMEAEAAKKGK